MPFIFRISWGVRIDTDKTINPLKRECEFNIIR